MTEKVSAAWVSQTKRPSWLGPIASIVKQIRKAREKRALANMGKEEEK